jgi:glucosamine kinase
MSTAILIADSGSTKAEWCLIKGGQTQTFFTQGFSPYFLTEMQIAALLQAELLPRLGGLEVDQICYYGTGCAAEQNRRIVEQALHQTFSKAHIAVSHDLMGAAKATCGRSPGVACILGTGSNSGYYDGKIIVKNSPGLGYVLGDEGSGAYLGKKVVQYYLYDTFDVELKEKFETAYHTTAAEILEAVYKKPLANRYLAQFALFLSQNRGHYMIENILEDGLNDFFFQHLCKYREIWTHPVHFVGGIADGFKDVIEQLCRSYEFELGQVFKNPMQGLVQYHLSANAHE